MKKVMAIFGAFLVASLMISGYAGFESKEVKIGDQVWMAENLNVDKFRNGEPIPQAKTLREWLKAYKKGQPAWCYYDNDTANGEKYGKLYNWYAVNDPRGLAPEGWHVPSDEEWTMLTDFLGGVPAAFDKMKSTKGWEEFNGTNKSGFNGLPGGFRFDESTFSGHGYFGYWWSSTEIEESSNYAWCRWLGGRETDTAVGIDKASKDTGFSVRCLRD